jgi:hypothetical protein
MAQNASVPRAAVITGGHCYDVPGFHRLFRGLANVDAYIQHMDDFASTPEEVRDGYDVVLFYIMLMAKPVDGGEWYEGQPRAAIEHLGSTRQGIFVLHHAILAYPGWDTWNNIVGIQERGFDFYPEQSIHVDVSGVNHPVTAGMAGWDMVDETYTMARQHGNSPVFCFQSGHDDTTWQDVGFRKALSRGISWCAGGTSSATDTCAD